MIQKIYLVVLKQFKMNLVGKKHWEAAKYLESQV